MKNFEHYGIPIIKYVMWINILMILNNNIKKKLYVYKRFLEMTASMQISVDH